jgi:hypothetical protein
LTVKSNAQPINKPSSETVPNAVKNPNQEQNVSTINACALCGISFQNAQEHRDHARSDHHRYNVKAQLRGTPILDEAEFTKAIGELDESISGSESWDSDDDESEPHAATDSNLVALLKKQAKISQEEGETTVSQEKTTLNREPIVWFSNPDLPENTVLGVYKAVFSNEEQNEPLHIVDSLRKKQLDPIKRVNHAEKAASNHGPHVFMCMIGGGNFAALVFGLAP